MRCLSPKRHGLSSEDRGTIVRLRSLCRAPTLHILCRKLLPRRPVLVLGKIVLREHFTRIYETVVTLHYLNHLAAFEEIVQLMTVSVLITPQHTTLLPQRTRRIDRVLVAYSRFEVRMISSSSRIWLELDAEPIVRKLKFLALVLLLNFQVVLVGACP